MDLSALPGYIETPSMCVPNFEQCVCVCISGKHCVDSASSVIGENTFFRGEG